MNNIEELKAAATAMRLSSTMRITDEIITFRRLSTPDCILNLIAQLEAAQKERDGLREKVNQSDTEWQKMADRILAVGKRAEKAEAALSAANEKLSKPVKLPKEEFDIYCGVFRDRGYIKESVIRAIHEAGFTVEGGVSYEH